MPRILSFKKESRNNGRSEAMDKKIQAASYNGARTVQAAAYNGARTVST
jgi:hypothetical protein